MRIEGGQAAGEENGERGGEGGRGGVWSNGKGALLARIEVVSGGVLCFFIFSGDDEWTKLGKKEARNGGGDVTPWCGG